MLKLILTALKNCGLYTSLFIAFFWSIHVYAANEKIPASADSSRLPIIELPEAKFNTGSAVALPKLNMKTLAPEATRTVPLHLTKITIKGATAFDAKVLQSTYDDFLNKDITLDKIWHIASRITDLYQDAGYFLSRAYVPAQEIDGGNVTIQVIEGYIGQVTLDLSNTSDKTLADYELFKDLFDRIKQSRPLNAHTLESQLLRLNSLPGKTFRTILEPIEKSLKNPNTEGMINLRLSPKDTADSFSINFNNTGSRYLGPYQTMVTYQTSFFPLQQTTLSILNSSQTEELKYFSFDHLSPIEDDWSFRLSGNWIHAKPGSSLKTSEIESKSNQFSLGLNWQPILQRQTNLTFGLSLITKQTKSTSLGIETITDEHNRILEGSLRFTHNDSWSGQNSVTAALRQGLELLSESKKGDANLSRSEANPGATVVKFEYSRNQAINQHWGIIGKIAGQLATDPLVSSEEFGYGGSSYGRAYDPSEITGDQGISGGTEIRYLSVPRIFDLSIVPYGFYDIGKMWDHDTQEQSTSAASAGGGIYLSHQIGLSSTFTMAWPLTRSINHPVSGGRKSPRLSFQLTYQF